MTNVAFLENLRQRIADTDAPYSYPDTELLRYIDDAIAYVCRELAEEGEGNLVQTGFFAQGSPLPPRFISWVGQVPYQVSGGGIQTDTPMFARYHAFPASLYEIHQSGAAWPASRFPLESYEGIVMQVAVILAKRRNEWDTSPDAAIPRLVKSMVSGTPEMPQGAPIQQGGEVLA